MAKKDGFMKTGSSFWLANALFAAALALSAPAMASPVHALDWSDRVQTENSDGSILNIPPFVTVNGVAEGTR